MSQPGSSENKNRFVSRLTKDTLALILAGGRGGRLANLTDWRTKPAVPFGGKFRIIDFPLSNCINSGVRRIGVLTQYKAHSLIQHVQRGWGFLRGEFDEFVELLPAQQRVEASWFAGTADAVYQNLDIIKAHSPKYVLILAGDHVYKMDYGPMLAFHVQHGADMTVGCIEVDKNLANAFGVMSVDNDYRIQSFVEKPSEPPTIPGQADKSLASMGIYVFSTEFLIDALMRDAHNSESYRDFAKDVIPDNLTEHKVVAYPFLEMQGTKHTYWRDVGTVDSFYESNLELIGVNPELNLYDDSWPIWTYQAQMPPAKFMHDEDGHRGMAVDSMVSGGDIIAGATVRHSLLFSHVRVNSYSLVENSVIMPDVTIGKNCIIRNAVIDEGCRIPDGTEIGVHPEEDAKRYYISKKGVTLVVPEMLGQSVSSIR